MHTRTRLLALLSVMLVLLAGCRQLEATRTDTVPSPPALSAATPLPGRATATPNAQDSAPSGLSPDEIATLNSLEQVDDYPLYTMHYVGRYSSLEARLGGSTREVPGYASLRAERGAVSARITHYASPLRVMHHPTSAAQSAQSTWACSLFAALGDPQALLYGRNFDWDPSPVLLLFSDPPDGYASVSMVDIAYLGFEGSRAQGLAGLPLDQRRALLGAPGLPFDGMNDQGLVVGMAAVPPGEMRPDPGKETIGSVGVIREMLDHARTVDEALAIVGQYNVDMEGGPPLHYLIADRDRHAALVEFYQGQMIVIPNDTPWHQATNFIRAAAGANPQGQCRRYDTLSERLARAQGQLSAGQAMDLLSVVAQPHTQWSIVYGISTREIEVVLGRRYDRRYTFSLK